MAEEHWSEFESTGYEIVWGRLMKALLIAVGPSKEQTQTNVFTILCEVLPHRFPLTLTEDDDSMDAAPARQECRVEEHTGSLTITTPNRTVTLNTLGNKTGFAADLVTTLIALDQADGRQSFHPVFFYYDRDHVVDDAHESFSFFVVNEDRIVLDRVTFDKHSVNGFDPNIFAPAFKVQTRSGRPIRM